MLQSPANHHWKAPVSQEDCPRWLAGGLAGFPVKTNVSKQKTAKTLLFYKKTKKTNILHRIQGGGNRFPCKNQCFQAKNTQNIAILQKTKKKQYFV